MVAKIAKIVDIKEFRKVSVYDFTLWFNGTQEFYDYMNLLLEWNEKINLTAITDFDEV